MLSNFVESTLRRVSWAVVALGMVSWGSLHAQDGPPSHVNLPPAFGATPLSTVISAQASYVAAQGDFLESAAYARKVNAQAVALELENWVNAVDDYFKRRESNRQWRRKEGGFSYAVDEERRQEALKRRMEKQFQEIVKGDLTGELNWLLTELSGPSMAVQINDITLNPDELKAFKAKLPKEALEQIYLTDGGHTGSRLSFAVDEAEMLKTPWPYVLRGPDFDRLRKEFDAARDAVVREIRETGHAGSENGARIVQALDELLVALETAYTPEDRKVPTAFLEYTASKHYLVSLVSQVHRALTTNDRSIFDGSLRFEGETVFDLIQHMYRNGLVFDRPHPGGERIYRNLFENVRNIYLTLGVGNK
jgi:hypothetical protein